VFFHESRPFSMLIYALRALLFPFLYKQPSCSNSFQYKIDTRQTNKLHLSYTDMLKSVCAIFVLFILLNLTYGYQQSNDYKQMNSSTNPTSPLFTFDEYYDHYDYYISCGYQSSIEHFLLSLTSLYSYLIVNKFEC